jgi:hypothetical protein
LIRFLEQIRPIDTTTTITPVLIPISSVTLTSIVNETASDSNLTSASETSERHAAALVSNESSHDPQSSADDRSPLAMVKEEPSDVSEVTTIKIESAAKEEHPVNEIKYEQTAFSTEFVDESEHDSPEVNSPNDRPTSPDEHKPEIESLSSQTEQPPANQFSQDYTQHFNWN